MRARACGGERVCFFAKPAQHSVGLTDMLLLAGEIARGLREPRLELRLARLGARLFALERVALDAQAMQDGGGRSLFISQRLKLFCGLRLLAQCLAFRFGFLSYRAKRGLERSLLPLCIAASAL